MSINCHTPSNVTIIILLLLMKRSLNLKMNEDGSVQICDQCAKPFYDLKAFLKHRRTHNIEQSSCDQCSKTFSNKIRAKAHELRAHQETEVFTCGYCNKEFRDEKNFRRHHKTHEVKIEISCKICRKTFSYREDNFKTHQKKCEEKFLATKEAKNLTCEKCPKSLCLLFMRLV
jgi:KRAB domain-containing zinc finger protein